MKNIRLNIQLITTLNNVLYMPAADVIDRARIANSTWYNIKQRPEGITVQQLLSIANGLCIPVRRFFSTGSNDAIGSRDDYIEKQYIPCHYDDKVLQDLVSNRSDATWKRAAEAVGMSYQRLKNSLTAVTRTPVIRFLTVCQTFEVDPFSILIDPNPEMPNVRRKSSGRNEAAIRNEIMELHQNIDELNRTVDELKQKYTALLAGFEQLERRVQVNIGTISGGNISNIGIATDQKVGSKDDDD